MKREARRREAAEERERALVREVTEKFAERQKQRRMLERGWELNMNFLSGNQYVGITPAGELEEEQPRYYWQCREVFNHIAPAIDTRCAKLAQVRPVMSVRAATGEEGDMRTAKISSNVLRSVLEECSFDETMARAAVWSETCGTSFYKVLWDASARGGEGGVCIAAVPPFEIYPEDLSCERVEDQPSIIHARAMPVAEISERYGIKAAPEKAEFPLAPYAAASNFAGGLGTVSYTHLTLPTTSRV